MSKLKKQSQDDRPLRTLRENAGLTQAKLAELMNCSRYLIVCYEAGKKTPSFDRAVALARSLNVSLKELAKAMNIDVTGLPDDKSNHTV